MQHGGSPPAGYGPMAARRRSLGPGRSGPSYYPGGTYSGPPPSRPSGGDDGYSTYDDRMSAPDLSSDFRRLSMGPPPRPERGRDPGERDRVAGGRRDSERDRSTPLRNNTTDPTISYGQRARSMGRPRSPGAESAPGPARSVYDPAPRGPVPAPAAPTPPPQQQRQYPRHAPSASLDRTGRYNPRGYHYSGPMPGYRGEPAYPDERSQGILMPARNPRMEMARRSSSSGTKGHRPSASVAGDVMRAGYGGPPAAGPGPSDSMALTAPNSARRSKSVSARGPMQRPVISGGNTAKKTQSTAVRLDVGGRELDINVKDPQKRRGPAIGSITINQNPAPVKKEEPAPAAPPPEAAPRQAPLSARLPPWEAQRRKYNDLTSQRGDNVSHRGFTEHGSADSGSDASSDEYSRYQHDFRGRATPGGAIGGGLGRTRSQSVGNHLYGRPQLQLGAPPAPGHDRTGGGPIPITATGGELRHTRISRKIVTREALEELNYQYEDTGATFTVFKILRPDEIDNLMDLTARIRATRHDSRRARSRPLSLEYPHSESPNPTSNPYTNRHTQSQSQYGDDNYIRTERAPHRPPRHLDSLGHGGGRGAAGGGDMPGAWPGAVPGPGPSGGGGGLRENPEMPGTYSGYTRGPALSSRDRGYYR